MKTVTTIFLILVFLCYLPNGTFINVETDDECEKAAVGIIYGK